MQVRHLAIKNFRGIEYLDWKPATPFTVLVGPGDVGKSTILDALEIALSPRWLSLTDADFYRGDTSKTIEVLVTVGDLPNEALREQRMGLHLRGWSQNGELHDEPDEDDEPVVTVRASADSSLDPSWELITNRSEPKTLSQRDRSLFGVVRLGADVERHLTWSQGSALARLGSSKERTSPVLADAYRRARELLGAGNLPWLDDSAGRVREASVKLGAYAAGSFAAGLDTQRASMSLGVLSLHDGGIPLRMAGLGSRRLVALAVERLSIDDGAIVLIDEIEHGLEPHRIRHALKVLRTAVAPPEGGEAKGRGGQVIMTTHSATTIVELACPQLSVVRNVGGTLALHQPAPGLQKYLRRIPEAFLSRKAVVCEGKTEVGLLRGLREGWASRHDNEPLEARGVALVDGNGSEAVSTATQMAELGYAVALLRDSDVPLTPEESKSLKKHNLTVFEWEGACSTEERVIEDASDDCLQKLLEIAFGHAGEESALDAVRGQLGIKEMLPREFARWNFPGKSKRDLRQALGKTAKSKGWFKQVAPGELFGEVLGAEIVTRPETSMAKTLAAVEAWAYGA
ncbi:ATP-binding protein [Pendulispora brunnea]|uniref:ATP-binding protein n=1 Tax=Pendulispora brunnea TaxID=2905690 RepID=A0ABZ2K952_9BACT